MISLLVLFNFSFVIQLKKKKNVFCCCWYNSFCNNIYWLFYKREEKNWNSSEQTQSSTKRKHETEVKRKMTHFTGVYPNICLPLFLPLSLCVSVCLYTFHLVNPSNTLPLLHSYLWLCVYFWLVGSVLLLLCWQWVYLFFVSTVCRRFRLSVWLLFRQVHLCVSEWVCE